MPVSELAYEPADGTQIRPAPGHDLERANRDEVIAELNTWLDRVLSAP